VEFKIRQFYCKNKKEQRKAILEQSQNPEGIKLIKKREGADGHTPLFIAPRASSSNHM
jgi:hypothetical protein